MPAVVSGVMDQWRYSEGPGYLVFKSLTRPSHVSDCCCQQLLLERVLPGRRAKLLCLTPKSMLACFHGNGNRTTACGTIHLFRCRFGPFLTSLLTDNLRTADFRSTIKTEQEGKNMSFYGTKPLTLLW